MIKYIIIDKRTGKALYGHSGITMCYSTEDIAKEVANQLFEKEEHYLIISITVKQ